MLVVKDIRRRSVDGMAEVRARVSCGRRAMPSQDAWIRYPESRLAHLAPTSDAWVPAMLLPAMRLGMPLRIEGAVSERMLASTNRYMDIIHGWCRDYRPVPIEADEVRPSVTGGREAVSYFSAGVDSFYTALVMGGPDVPPDRRVRTLLYVMGFDVFADDAAGNQGALQAVTASAAELGMDLLCVSTNLRSVTRRLCGWGYYHGTLLASVALGLAGALRLAYVPSTYTLESGVSHGSHPDLDPLWSTESLEFVHHGADVLRTEKIFTHVAKSPTALKYLRVCSRGDHGAANCGHCIVCVRCRINMAVAGVLDQCRTLDAPLDYREIRHMRYEGPGGRHYARDNLQAAVARGADPELIDAIRFSLSPVARLMPWYWSFYAHKASRAVRRHLLGGILEKATWQRWLKE
jgi:hypothetical protein